MAKKSKVEKRPVADELEEIIQQDLISDRSIPWEDCANQLDQLSEFCANWAQTIREEHKGE